MNHGLTYFLESTRGTLRIYAVNDADAVERGRAAYGAKLLKVLAPTPAGGTRIVWSKESAS